MDQPAGKKELRNFGLLVGGIQHHGTVAGRYARGADAVLGCGIGSRSRLAGRLCPFVAWIAPRELDVDRPCFGLDQYQDSSWSGLLRVDHPDGYVVPPPGEGCHETDDYAGQSDLSG